MWGGSVVDSVVGTMLTQNATDVSSAQAIMNLNHVFAARDGQSRGCNLGTVAKGRLFMLLAVVFARNFALLASFLNLNLVIIRQYASVQARNL